MQTEGEARVNGRQDRTWVALAAVIAAGVVLAGWFVGRGFERGRLGDRFVTVKGLSEREVEADLAIWPLQFVSADDDLGAAQARLDRNVRRTIEFLADRGIDTTAVARQGLRVTDAEANLYRPTTPTVRYVVAQTLIVRSDDPHRVLAASQSVGELVQSGVAVSSGPEYGPGGPTFLFTRLNELKPEMIAEATARGREAAEQFAADSRSRIGGIRRASQGVFEILARDPAPGIDEAQQLHKRVRVVSTIEYHLRD